MQMEGKSHGYKLTYPFGYKNLNFIKNNLLIGLIVNLKMNLSLFLNDRWTS